MSTHNLSEGYIVENLITADLVKIMEEIGSARKGNLCTVQIEEQNGELSLYGVFNDSPGWVESYHISGGVWSYYQPEHYIQMLAAEFKRRGLYATDVRKA